MGLQDRLDDPAAAAARQACASYYAGMEECLAEGDFLCGQYSFADIAFYMAQLFAHRMGAPMPEATPRLIEWRKRVTKRPAVTKVVANMARFLTSHRRPVPDFIAELI
jgi:glutathione S-transferase